MVVNPLAGKSMADIAAMAKAKWASQWQIDAGYWAVGQSVPPIIQNAMGQWTPWIQQPKTWFANPFSQWEDGDIAMAGRRASTVATPNNPVIDRTIKPWDLQYDPNDPNSFVMRANARTALGGKLSEEDLFNYQVALSAKQKAEMPEDPFKDILAQQQTAIDEMKASQLSQRDRSIASKQQELDAKYWQLRTSAEQAGQRRSDASQSATSFSGFGRSTFNADQQVQIEQSTSQAISQLEAAKQMELQAYQAELDGVDAETLSAMYDSINTTKEAANKRQLESIAEAAKINAGMGASMQDAITNLLASAWEAGMTIWPDDAKSLEAIAWAVSGMNAQQREEYLWNFDPQQRALIEWAANVAGRTSFEAPDIQKTGKNSYGYFDAQWNLINIGWGSGGGGWGWGGGSGGGWNQWPSNDWTITTFDPSLSSVYIKVNEWASLDIQRFTKLYWISAGELTKQAQAWKYNTLSADVSNALDTLDILSANYPWRNKAMLSETFAWRLNQDNADFYRQYQYIKNNLTMDKLVALKSSWATFGALSDSERVAIWNAANAIALDMSPAEFKRQLGIIDKILKKSVGNKDPRAVVKEEIKPPEQKKWWLNPSSIKSFSEAALAQWATQAEIKAYIAANQAQFR